MRLSARLDTLARKLPSLRTTPNADEAVQKICEGLEQYALIPAGEVYPDVDTRLDAALDRLYAAGVGIAEGPNTSQIERIAAVYGITTAELQAALRERAGQ